MCKTTLELVKILNHCFYQRKSNDPNNDVMVCNFCGHTEYTIGDIIEHVLFEHSNETIPDVDPTK